MGWIDFRRACAALVFGCVVLLAASLPASAQSGSTPKVSDNDPASVATALAPLSTQERDALIGKLTDEQARGLLLYYLSENAPAAQPEASSTAAALSMKALQEKGTQIRQNLEAVLSESGHVVGNYVGHMQQRLRIGVGHGGLLLVFGTILGLAVAGGILEWIYRYLTRAMVERYEAAPVETVRQKLSRAFGQLLHGLGAIAAFAIGFIGSFLIVWAGDVPRRDFLIVVLLAILITRVSVAVVRFVFLPNHPSWRLMPVDDEAAAHFVRGTRRQVALGIALLLFSTLGRMWGVDHNVWRLGAFLSAIVFVLSYCFFLWRYRRHALRAVRASFGGGTVPRWAEGAAGWTWYALAVGYVIVAFLIGIYSLLLGLPFDPLGAAVGFFILFVANPYVTAVLKALFSADAATVAAQTPAEIYVTDPDDGEQVMVTRDAGAVAAEAEAGHAPATAATDASQAVLRDQRILGRVISISVLVVSLAVFALVIGVDIFSSTSPYPLAKYVLRVLINIGIIVLLGYVAWSFIATWIDRKLAQEQASAPHDGHDDDNGPALSAGTRLQTILPIFRKAIQVAIGLIVLMVALSSMGVNIAPLIAGAGIFGLAIGFGAQTLVKDLISGLFFLMDDAFRIGEFIEAGGTSGAVERFNARSLVLRGTLGAVYTVPYGDLGKVTNFSRDWVIMKLRFRVPYDTDIDKVRKIFKKIGQEMMEDPELAPNFIQPFKSQGVVQMDDSAFIVSGKFMAKPTKQWGIRKAVYQKVQEAFHEAGIKFAPKRVIVDVPGATTFEDDHPAEAAGGKPAEGAAAKPTELSPEAKAAIAAAAVVATEETPPAKKG